LEVEESKEEEFDTTISAPTHLKLDIPETTSRKKVAKSPSPTKSTPAVVSSPDKASPYLVDINISERICLRHRSDKNSIKKKEQQQPSPTSSITNDTLTSEPTEEVFVDVQLSNASPSLDKLKPSMDEDDIIISTHSMDACDLVLEDDGEVSYDVKQKEVPKKEKSAKTSKEKPSRQKSVTKQSKSISSDSKAEEKQVKEKPKKKNKSKIKDKKKSSSVSYDRESEVLANESATSDSDELEEKPKKKSAKKKSKRASSESEESSQGKQKKSTKKKERSVSSDSDEPSNEEDIHITTESTKIDALLSGVATKRKHTEVDQSNPFQSNIYSDFSLSYEGLDPELYPCNVK
jgi:hypothetical protein